LDTPERKAKAMMRRLENGDVQITISAASFQTLLLALGYASGSAWQKQDRELFSSFLQLANTINVGNPEYKPYAIPEKILLDNGTLT
jgi:hypothetical protein